MSDQMRIELLRNLRQQIARLEASIDDQPQERSLQRVVAYLWMAHDELEQLVAPPLHA